jgi:hypothetical protein
MVAPLLAEGIHSCYEMLNPNERVNLGSPNRGNNKLRLPDSFAKFLLNAIIEID